MVAVYQSIMIFKCRMQETCFKITVQVKFKFGKKIKH